MARTHLRPRIMGCGASSLRRPTVDARGGGESYVHLKHLEKSVALSGKVATRPIPHRKEYAAPLRGDGDDATEVADTRSSYLNSSHEGESVSASLGPLTNTRSLFPPLDPCEG